MSIYKIKNMLRRERRAEAIQKRYAEQNRFIRSDIYNSLKKKRTCYMCKNTYDHPLQIHHIVPVCKGGSNEASNLAVLCSKCHKEIHDSMKHR